MSERPFRNPETLEPVDRDGLFTEGVFTVIQSYDYKTGRAHFAVVPGDCTPEAGVDTGHRRYEVLYPGSAIEVLRNGKFVGLAPRIIENNAGMAEEYSHRPRVISQLDRRNIVLKPPLF